MRDIASRTIDRHEPIIPDYIQGEITILTEKLQTKIKNEYILPNCNVGQIKRWAKNMPASVDKANVKTITEGLLNRAGLALDKSFLLDDHKAYLKLRNIYQDDNDKFRIVSTQVLCQQLNDEDIGNLSLKISGKFSELVDSLDINGVSIPYYNHGKLYGFCTRILDNPLIKYSITIPHRFCFGLDNVKNTDYIIVVEGIFDAIPLINAGYNCLALGDSQPNYWKMLQANKYKEVYLLFDNDYSGKLGAAKSHVILEEMLGRDSKTIHICVPEVEEPPIYISKNGIPAMLKSKITLRELANILTILGRDI